MDGSLSDDDDDERPARPRAQDKSRGLPDDQLDLLDDMDSPSFNSESKAANNDVISSDSSEKSEKVSHLPSWLLSMRSRIEESRLAHQQTESRISKINDDVSILAGKLKQFHPDLTKDPKLSLVARSIDTISQPKLKPIAKQKPVVYVFIDVLPPDLLAELFQLLETPEIFRLCFLSRKHRSLVEHSDYWWRVEFFRHYFLFHERSSYDLRLIPIAPLSPLFPALSSSSRQFMKPMASPDPQGLLVRRALLSQGRSDFYLSLRRRTSPAEVFRAVQRHYEQWHRALLFLQQMKDQRSVPKHSQVLPRRHSRAERDVTHPLPLLGRGLGPEKVMSHAETLSSDFRSFAHRALDGLVQATAACYDGLCDRLVGEGAATVMVSLLANEEAALQNYACAVLANLLLWESLQGRKVVRFQRLAGAAGLAEGEDTAVALLERAARQLRSYKFPLNEQLVTCNGLRALCGLLTSPSASINLAGGGRKEQHVAADGSVVRSWKSTASIQGVCTKHASRALVNAFFPACPVASRMPSLQDFLAPAPALALAPASPQPVAGLALSPSSPLRLPPLQEGEAATSIWRFRPLPPLAEPASFKGPSSQRPLKESPPQQQQQPAWRQQQTALSPLQLLLLTDSAPRAWQFTYFYKLGAFKDQFVAFLRFFSLGVIRGRGVDHIGPFTLEGRSETDIIGQKLLLSKTYLSGGEAALTTSLESLLVAEGDELSGPLPDGASAALLQETADKVAHVRHLGYWADDVRCTAEGPGDYWKERAEGWSQGLWGVWETASGQAHYELQKGGVFRAVPLESLDPLGRGVIE
jgi:hypothetical protein